MTPAAVPQLIQGKLLDTVTDVAEEFAQFAAVHPRVRPESESKAEVQ